jgi:hypothetical protein
MQMGLHAVAVEFQFMDETAGTRHLAAQYGKAGLDEVGEWRGLRAGQHTGKEADEPILSYGALLPESVWFLAAPAARCKNERRGSFMARPLWRHQSYPNPRASERSRSDILGPPYILFRTLGMARTIVRPACIRSSRNSSQFLYLCPDRTERT